jgi:hypothetical protein
MARKPSAAPQVCVRGGRKGSGQRCGPLPTTSTRARQSTLRPGERVYDAPARRLSKAELQRQCAAQARQRRAEDARARTLYEFGLHRGTRVSISHLQQPIVPPTRRRR